MEPADDDVPMLVPLDAPAPMRIDVTRTLDKGGHVSAPNETNSVKNAEEHKVWNPCDPDRDARTETVVPITIVAGWLGAGKTTLLQYLVRELSSQNKKVAIINNEVTATGVDAPMLLTDDNTSAVLGDVVELANGCVCCSIRNDFVLGLEALMKKRQFDHIFVECSGLVNPGPLAAMFWLDDALQSNITLDGIVSVADASYLDSHLADGQPQARQVVHQLAHADRILLNKTDLVSANRLETLQRRLQAINGVAPILLTVNSRVPLASILNIRAFQSDDAEASVSKQTAMRHHDHRSADHHSEHASPMHVSMCRDVACVASGHVHGTAPAHSATEPDHCDDTCFHDRSISTVILEDASQPLSLSRFRAWFAELLWSESLFRQSQAPPPEAAAPGISGPLAMGSSNRQLSEVDAAAADANKDAVRVFRTKGVLWLEGDEHKHYVQGVAEVFDIQPSLKWAIDEIRFSRLVIIGRHLNARDLEQRFRSCLVKT